MDAVTTPVATPRVRLNPFLPYWAVFQADFKDTFNSWLYRGWVVMSVGVVVGSLLYHYGAKQVSGMIQQAPETIGDVLHWVIYGGVTLVIALTAGAICSERGSVADSILSRGISRRQYFMGKWHARLTLVLTTYFIESIVAIVGAYYMLHSDSLTIHGCLVAMMIVASMLLFVITYAVSVSAVSSNTLVSIAVVWVTLYGGGFLLTQLPSSVPSPERALQKLPDVMKGFYDWNAISRTMLISLGVSMGTALVGMFCFSRKDV